MLFVKQLATSQYWMCLINYLAFALCTLPLCSGLHLFNSATSKFLSEKNLKQGLEPGVAGSVSANATSVQCCPIAF